MVYGKAMVKRCICPLKGIDIAKTPCQCSQRSPSLDKDAASAPLPTDSESEYSSIVRHKRVRPYSVYAVTEVDPNDDEEQQPPAIPLTSDGNASQAKGDQPDQTTPRRNPLMPLQTPPSPTIATVRSNRTSERLPTMLPTPQRRPVSMIAPRSNPRHPAPNPSPATNNNRPEATNVFYPALPGTEVTKPCPLPPPAVDFHDSFDDEEAGSPIRKRQSHAQTALQEQVTVDEAHDDIFIPQRMDQASPKASAHQNLSNQNHDENINPNAQEKQSSQTKQPRAHVSHRQRELMQKNSQEKQSSRSQHLTQSRVHVSQEEREPEHHQALEPQQPSHQSPPNNNVSEFSSVLVS